MTSLYPATRLPSTIDFDYYSRYCTGFFKPHWAWDRSRYSVVAQDSALRTAHYNFATCIELANNWRKTEPRIPVGIQLSTNIRVIITKEETFIVAAQNLRTCVLDNQSKQVGLVFKPKNMSLGEFFLRASYASAAVGNQMTAFFDCGENNAIILLSSQAKGFNAAFFSSIKKIGAATSEALFKTTFLDSVAHKDYKTVSFYLEFDFEPTLLDKGFQIASQIKDIEMVELLGSKALEEASKEGDFDRVLRLIVRGVPGSADAKARQIAQEKGHQKIVDFFDDLHRMTNS